MSNKKAKDMKRNLHSPTAVIAVILGAVFALSACSPVDEDMPRELKELTANIKGNIEDLPVYKSYSATPYDGVNLTDPFGSVKAKIDSNADQSNEDAKRPRDPLESFSLESLQFNGTIVQRGVVHALITAQENLYTVKLGDHMGQNLGRVIKISENEIILMEKIQEANGEWVEHKKPIALSSQ